MNMAKKEPKETPTQKAREINTLPRKRLYTLKEGATYLGRSEWGMRELIWAGVIPVVKPQAGRKIFLDVRDLDQFVEKNKAVYR